MNWEEGCKHADQTGAAESRTIEDGYCNRKIKKKLK